MFENVLSLRGSFLSEDAAVLETEEVVTVESLKEGLFVIRPKNPISLEQWKVMSPNREVASWIVGRQRAVNTTAPYEKAGKRLQNIFLKHIDLLIEEILNEELVGIELYAKTHYGIVPKYVLTLQELRKKVLQSRSAGEQRDV